MIMEQKGRLTVRYNLIFNMGIPNFFVIPHDAVFHGQILQRAVVANGHIRADGAILDGDVLADDAGRN